MPYRHAHWFVGLTLVVIVWGFWGSYFTPIGEVPLAFHVHAITALAWVGLLLLQHWTIHHRHRDLHRTAGKLSLALFPFLIVGFVMIINVSAQGYIHAERASDAYLNPSFALAMVFAITAYVVLYYQALKHRRNIRLHAGYMLATPIILFESPFSRVMLNDLPFLVFTSSPFPQRALDAIVIAMVASAAFALVVYWRVGRAGVPFLFAAILLLAESAAMYGGTHLSAVHAGLTLYAQLPAALTLGAGFLLGAATAWYGWRNGGSGSAQAAGRVAIAR